MIKENVQKTHEQPALAIRDSVIQLAELSAVLFDTPEAIQTKILLIKEKLNTDKYHVHSTHIANKLLEFASRINTPEPA